MNNIKASYTHKLFAIIISLSNLWVSTNLAMVGSDAPYNITILLTIETANTDNTNSVDMISYVCLKNCGLYPESELMEQDHLNYVLPGIDSNIDPSQPQNSCASNDTLLLVNEEEERKKIQAHMHEILLRETGFVLSSTPKHRILKDESNIISMKREQTLIHFFDIAVKIDSSNVPTLRTRLKEAGCILLRIEESKRLAAEQEASCPLGSTQRKSAKIIQTYFDKR